VVELCSSGIVFAANICFRFMSFTDNMSKDMYDLPPHGRVAPGDDEVLKCDREATQFGSKLMLSC
jgi:hypothetical protein